MAFCPASRFRWICYRPQTGRTLSTGPKSFHSNPPPLWFPSGRGCTIVDSELGRFWVSNSVGG